MQRGRAWLTTAALLAGASLGLPWAGELIGADLPARVAVALGAALAVVGLRTGGDRVTVAAAVVGAAGALVGGGLTQPAGSPGRLSLAAAVVCLVLGARSVGPGGVRARNGATRR
ncbi:hypothetical protein [Modestobacter marinus]|uniref:hypothetical protein n=1 Tax=Modestobacter marinus TaxID=477641 RepID=UPI001C954748|nr:hypothetical protein [Modestobacter marinus]